MDAGCLGGRLTTTNTFDPLFHTADASPHALGIVPVDRCHSLQAFGSVWFDEGVAVVAFTHARWRTLACCCCLGVGDRGGGGGRRLHTIRSVPSNVHVQGMHIRVAQAVLSREVAPQSSATPTRHHTPMPTSLRGTALDVHPSHTM